VCLRIKADDATRRLLRCYADEGAEVHLRIEAEEVAEKERCLHLQATTGRRRVLDS